MVSSCTDMVIFVCSEFLIIGSILLFFKQDTSGIVAIEFRLFLSRAF